MTKRGSRNATMAAGPAAGLRIALTKCKKEELIGLLVDLATDDRATFRALAGRVELHPPPKGLVAATRRAIADATDFDDRDVNCNFDYDYEAYDEIKRNLKRLIGLGQLRPAMELSIELMKEGSHQVEMSDEGVMTDDIAECLMVVIRCLTKRDLPPGEIVAWCEKMRNSDRVGFICDKELESLRKQSAARWR